jgi:hypothetical protein
VELLPDYVNVWFSGGGTTSNLHFDPSHNYICQLQGNKSVTLLSPDDSGGLYPVEFPGAGLKSAESSSLSRRTGG